MVRVKEELIDKLAQLEINALIEALQDPELCKDPQILARARTFLKDNKMVTQPETPGVSEIKKATMKIPDFDKEQDSVMIQ